MENINIGPQSTIQSLLRPSYKEEEKKKNKAHGRKQNTVGG